MGRIKALDPDVVHKIAAGEIIISPANALKELIENSIDAGASNIDVVVKDGGHKLLQITDNGSGIDEEDLPILCQRFTTSKISQFQDLETVETLGFRGEALASISHIAHLTVKTKTQQSKTAILATFENGKLISTKKSAGVQGTQISVEDLFYNVPLRMKALQSTASRSAEYQKILDVISKYAIQYSGTFSCKRHQDNQPVVIPSGTRKEKIKKVYGSSTFQELMNFNLPAMPEYGFIQAEGYVTGLNYTSKRSIPFIFFINKRLVSCEPLSRAIRKVYQEYMPRGGALAFVFLSITIESQNVDVNIHPTKREVHFLNDVEIIEAICEHLKSLLTQTSSSRDFGVQSYISATTLPSGNLGEEILASENRSKGSSRGSSVAGGVRPQYEYNLVRTDPKQQRITAFVQRPQSSRRISLEEDNTVGKIQERAVKQELNILVDNTSSAEKCDDNDDDNDEDNDDDDDDDDDEQENNVEKEQYKDTEEDESEEEEKDTPGNLKEAGINSIQNSFQSLKTVQLESIHDLLKDIKLHASAKLLELFSEHSFIGIVDASRGLAAVQLDVRLYLVEYHNVFEELFYQIGLTQFANFGTIHLGDGVPLEDLLQLSNTQGNLEPMIEMQAMLEEYFQIIITKKQNHWRLVQLPLMLPGFTPPISRLPQFIAYLSTKVDWENERECLEGIIKALANLHIPTSQATKEEIETLFDAAKINFVPSRSLISCVIEIASLPGLYKVFERC